MKNLPKIGTRVLMPEPRNDDNWQHGGFIARIARYRNENLVVVDADDDAEEIQRRDEKNGLYADKVDIAN